MKQIILPNHLRFGIGEKGKGVAHFPGVPPVSLYRIDANRGNADAAGIEFRQMLLKTPQLGVTQDSPITAVED